jgi:hypothetical protein
MYPAPLFKHNAPPEDDRESFAFNTAIGMLTALSIRLQCQEEWLHLLVSKIPRQGLDNRVGIGTVDLATRVGTHNQWAITAIGLIKQGPDRQAQGPADLL